MYLFPVTYYFKVKGRFQRLLYTQSLLGDALNDLALHLQVPAQQRSLSVHNTDFRKNSFIVKGQDILGEYATSTYPDAVTA